MKKLLGLLLLCGLLLLSVRFFFLDQTATFILGLTGVDDIRVRGVQVGLKQIHIDELSGTFTLASGENVRAEILKSSLQYDLRQLVATGRASRLEIEALEIIWIGIQKGSGAALHLPNQVELINDTLRGRIPLREMIIKQLQFHGDLPPQLTEKAIQVNAVVKDVALAVAATVQVTSDISITMDLQSPDALHATAAIKILKRVGEDATIATVRLALKPDALSGNVECEVKTLNDLFLQPNSGSDGLLALSGRLVTSLEIPLVATEEKTLSVTVDGIDLLVRGVSVSSAHLQLAGKLEDGALVFTQQSMLLAKEIGFGKTDIDAITLGLAGNFRKTGNQLQLHFSDQQRLEIEGLAVAKLQFAKLAFSLANPLHMSISGNSWSVVDNSLLIGPLHIQEGTKTFMSDLVRCSFSGLNTSFPELGVSTDIQIATAVLGDTVQSLPLKEVRGSVQLKDKHLRGELQVAPASIPGQMQLRFDHEFSSATGRFSLLTASAFELSSEGAKFSDLFTSWQYPFNLESGSLSFQTDGAWDPSAKLQLSVTLELIGGSGYGKKFLFNGLDVKQDLIVLPGLESRSRGSFSLQHLTGGVDTYEIRADLTPSQSTKGKKPLLHIDNFRASLLGGTITTSGIQYDMNQPDSNFVVTINTMNLAELVGLINMDTLQVTGRVSGSIPVRVKGKDVSVADGELHSDESGEIRYEPGNMNQSGLAGYALKAVENMQYKVMTVGAEYMPSGQLDLDIGLQGTSPGLQTTRPVHLNIHAEQNLPALLQSLRFSKGLTEKLDKRVQQHYN